ncbi:MAG: hypothetical protein JO021_24105 [Alphaproteobacteria bacterium]|nr:hypothetical protein [Alphaproteobacteria bacterium]
MVRWSSLQWLILGVATALSVGPSHAQTANGISLPGDRIQGQRIVADADRATHLFLRDGSVVSAARGTDVTIDSFVYEPAQGPATLALTLATGSVRIVAGRAGAVTLDTPSARLGLDDGVAFVAVDGTTGTTEAIQAVGKRTSATSRSTGEQTATTRNGYAVRITPGQPIAVAPVGAPRLSVLQVGLDGGTGAAMASAETPFDDGGRSPDAARRAPTPSDRLLAIDALTQPLVARTAQTMATAGALVAAVKSGSVSVSGAGTGTLTVVTSPTGSVVATSGAGAIVLFGSVTAFDRGGGTNAAASFTGSVFDGTTFGSFANGSFRVVSSGRVDAGILAARR